MSGWYGPENTNPRERFKTESQKRILRAKTWEQLREASQEIWNWPVGSPERRGLVEAMVYATHQRTRRLFAQRSVKSVRLKGSRPEW